MENFLSFALGYLTEDINSSKIKLFLDYLRKLGFQGVEITFGPKERLYSFKLNKDLKYKLRQFQYITIHAPFELVKDSKNEEEVIKQLDIIAELYSNIKAKRIIIHPDNLPKPKTLERYNFKVSTENLKKKRNISTSKLKKIFKEYPKIGLCLDVAHAYSWSKYEVENLVNNFGSRINQIHFSASYRNKHHQSLRKASKEFLSSIEQIKRLKVPIVIEESIKKIDLNQIKREIDFIKNIFNS